MVPMPSPIATYTASPSSLTRLNLGAVQLEFQERGSGDPVLLIHAALLADWFTPLLAQMPLTERCRLISYHRVGFAGSSRATARLSVFDQARQAREVLAELGIGRARVVGHSSGACIALQLALDAPDLVQSLALLEPVVASGPVAEEFARTEVGPAFARYAAGDRAGAVDQFMRAIGGPDYRPLIERTLGVGALQQVQADADTFFQIEGPSVNAWQFKTAEAARVQQPVLLVGGADSRPVYHEGRTWLLERLPRAEGRVVRRANHLLPLQQPRRLAETLASFFAVHPMADSR